jgi:hypothetical protein
MIRRPIRRRTAAALTACLAAVTLAVTPDATALVGPPSEAPQLDPTDTTCSVFVPSPDRYCAPIPLPAEATALGTIIDVDPEDAALYESLIPAPFSAPDDVGDYQLSLLVFWLEIPPTVGTDGSQEGQYIEGQYALRAQRDGKEGWFQLHVPVSNDSLYDAGRQAGLPKYLADMAMTSDEEGWLAVAGRNDDHGPDHVSIDYTADEGSVASEELVRLVTQQDVFFGSCPHLDGTVPTADYEPNRWWESKYTSIPTAELAPPEAGTVALTLTPGELVDWGPLLPDEDGDGTTTLELPGIFWHAEGLVIATWDPQGAKEGPADCA